jgi:hypothetical protein
MTSLFNVVALIHSFDTLEVRQVSKRAEDPFLQFSPQLLYRDQEVDSAHAPLLYGPYVLYASLDGNWYRVNYEAARKKEDPFPLPASGSW